MVLRNVRKRVTNQKPNEIEIPAWNWRIISENAYEMQSMTDNAILHNAHRCIAIENIVFEMRHDT